MTYEIILRNGNCSNIIHLLDSSKPNLTLSFALSLRGNFHYFSLFLANARRFHLSRGDAPRQAIHEKVKHTVHQPFHSRCCETTFIILFWLTPDYFTLANDRRFYLPRGDVSGSHA